MLQYSNLMTGGTGLYCDAFVPSTIGFAIVRRNGGALMLLCDRELCRSIVGASAIEFGRGTFCGHADVTWACVECIRVMCVVLCVSYLERCVPVRMRFNVQ